MEVVHRHGVVIVLMMLAVMLLGCSDGATGPNGGSAEVLPDSAGRGTIVVAGDFVSGLARRPANPDCLAANFAGLDTGIRLERVFSSVSLNQPVAMVAAPDGGGQWYVAQREGVILRLSAKAPDAFVVADLSDRVESGDLEQGLLGLAFHPDFPKVRELFVSYTGAGGASVISRFAIKPDGALDRDSERIVLTQSQPYGNHNGGHIAFGPDGYLYIGFGDGGYGDDPHDNGQNTGNLLGAMLRIDISRQPYAIPPDNPFADSQGCSATSPCPEVWAWGLRNPWRWSFDRQTGKLWLGDVGQDKWEEVDLIERGRNYGWRCYEGNHAFNPEGCGDRADYAFPLAEYGHDEGRSITGGYVYRGKRFASLYGMYLYADFVSGDIWGLNASVDGARPVKLLEGSGRNIASFAEAPDGELYLLDFQGGIYRIAAGPAPTTARAAFKLSETGCVDPDDPTRFVDGVIHYDVNSRLWSDGAEKWRGFALPDGARVAVDDEGDWHFPSGSVLVKEFRLQGRRVETRFLVNQDNQWRGYTFAWNEAGDDAELVTRPESRRFGGTEWKYPAGQCFECHAQAAHVALGPENVQLNRVVGFPSTGLVANQLGSFASVGLLTLSQDRPLSGIDALVDPADDTAPLQARARAYLHANCSGCHRPFSNGRGALDLRWQTTLADLGGCGVAASFGDLHSASGLLIAPGDGADSVLVRRMETLDPSRRMPPLGTDVVDDAGVRLISDWIDSLSGCG